MTFSRMKLAAIAAVAGALLLNGEASAWNLRGHMMVSAAAWDQLTPGARARAVELLKKNPDYRKWIAGVPAAQRGKVAFTRAAGWADDIKSRRGYVNDSEGGPDATRNTGYDDKAQHRYWHYIDLPFSTDATPFTYPSEPNAKTQIYAFQNTLSSPFASEELKSYNMVWLLHLVGDVHQPLHATGRFTGVSPRGDKGGNDVRLCRNPCRDNLHSFWDGALGSGNRPSTAINTARNLPQAADTGVSGDAFHWINESFEIAKVSAYAPPVGPGNGPYTLNASYKQRAKQIARERAALGAARLARMLNDRLR